MSTTIDERVVEMRFDNKAFESNVKTSMSTLERLKKSLRLEDASKGLEKVNAAARNCNMSGFTGAIETVHAKFSAFEVMAVTALANITNSAINAGKQIVSALTIDPVKSGFQEYETQINAVQTILANTQSKGSTIKDVNKALDELNHYADLTIYNFTEMTRNIGTFTAAGVDLDTSVRAIKGIANLAAVSGSTSQQASTAMYQLSQALASGTVKLQDWNSVVNAGMGGQIFQDALKETARVHGISIDSMIKKEGSFRETLSKGWLSSEILTETLSKFTGDLTEAELKSMGYTEEQIKSIRELGTMANDAATKVKTFTQLFDTLKEAAQSGWTQTWQTIVGDFEEAKLFLTDLSDIFGGLIGESADARNNMLQGWSDLGGRELLLESVRNSFNAIMNAVIPMKEAFREIFPATTSQQLYNLTAGLKELTRRMIPNTDTAEKLQRSFKGLFAALDIVSTITGGALKTGLKLFCKLLGMADFDILSVTASAGDAIVRFREWLYTNNIFVKGIEKLITGGKECIKIVRGWINEFMDLPEVQQNIARFEAAFSNAFSNFQEYFGGGIDRINAFIERVKAMDSITLDDVSEIFKDFKNNVIDYFLNMDGCFDDIKMAVKDFKEDVKKYFHEAGENVDGFKKKIIDFAESIKQKFSDNIGIGEILTIGIGGGLILFVKKIGDALETLAGPIGDLAGILSNFNGMLKSCSKTINAFAFKTKSQALINIAIAIGILTASIVALTLVDQTKLWSVVGAIGILAGGLLAVSAVMGVLGKLGGGKGASAMLGIAGSLLILVAALKSMESLDGDKVWGNVGVLGAMASGLAIIAGLLGTFAPRLSKGSIALIGIAASLKIMVSALKDLDGLELNNMGHSIKILLGAMGGLVALAVICKNIKLGSAVAIIGTVVALKVFVGVFKDIANLDTSTMKMNMDAFVGIFGTFAVLMVASKFAGANAAKAGVGILAMSAALLLITVSLKAFTKMDAGDLDQATDAMSQLLLVFVGVVAVSKFAGANAVKAGAMLLLMSAALMILSGVIVILSHIKPDGLNQALKAIATLELLFAGLIAVSSLAKECKSTLVLISVTIGILAVALGTLSMINPENLSAASKALSMVMATFALLVASTSLTKKASGTIVVLTAVVAALGGILFLLSGLPVASVTSVASALSVLLLSLSASMLIISMAGPIVPGAYLTLGVMTLVVAGLAGIIGVLAYMNVGPVLKIAQGLSKLLISLSASCLILSAVGITGAAAYIGVGALVTLIAAVGGLMAGIGALAEYYPGMETFLSKGLVILEKIGYGLGSFFGNVISGFAAGMTSGLPEIGTNLSAFMENAQPFFSGISDLDAEALSGVKALAETILILTATDVINGLTSWYTGGSSLSSFAEELVPFGEAMTEFSKSITGLKGDTVSNAAIAGKAMAEMASTLPNSGGKLAEWIGDNTLSSFAEELKIFGPAIKEYAVSVTGLDADVVTNSANAALSLAEFANAIPNSGGKLAEWIGDNTLSSFAEELKLFGPAIKEYANKVTGLDADVVTNSANAALSLAELANKLPNSGGVLAYWLGDNTISSFAEELKLFGPAIKEYANKVTGLDVDVVANSANAALSLAELANKLPNGGGRLAWFTGDNDMATFGENLVSFGQNFKRYSNYMAKIDPGIVTATTNAANSIVKLQNGLPEKGGLFSDKNSLATFGNDIAAFGSAFSVYYSYISNIKTDTLSGVIVQTNSLVAMAKGMETVNTDSMKSFGNALTKLGDMGIDGFISAFANGKTKAINAINTFIDAVVNATKKKHGDFQKAGSYVVEGFIKGIKDKTNEAAKASAEMAKASYKAAMKELDEHSPSKKFYEIGKNEAQGEINGKTDMKPKVEKSSEELGKASTESFTNALKEGASSVKMITTDTLGSYRNFWDEYAGTAEKGVTDLSEAEGKGVESTKKAVSSTKAAHAEAIDEEMAYWARLLEIKKHGAEAEKYQTMTMAEFQKDIVSKTKELLDDYNDSMKSNTDSLMNRSSLFKEVADQDGVRTSTLTKNLKEQIRQMEKYSETLTSLNERIPEGGLRDTINEMGVDSLAELKALNSMTDEELTNYVSLYDQKYALCQQAATTQLSGLRTETEQKLSEIYGGVNVNLQQLAQSFDGTFESIKGYVSEAITIGNQLAAGVGTGILSGIGSSIEAIKQLIIDTAKAAKEAADIHSPSGLFEDEVGKYITEGVAVGMTDASAMAEVTSSAHEISNSAIDAFDESKEKFVQSGTAFIESFKEGMNNSATVSLGSDVITTVLENIRTAIFNSQAAFRNEGTSILTYLIDGMKNKSLELDMETQTILSIILTAIRNKYMDFTNVGSECMNNFILGIKENESKARSMCVTITNTCLTALKGRYQEFYNAGSYLVDGFSAGINENTWKAEARARAMARAAADAAEEELDEHSPSRVGYRIGDYFGVAFVNAIANYEDRAYTAGSGMAASARNGLSNAISKIKDIVDDNIETQPTIRPVLDLSSVEIGASRLNALFSRTRALSINTQMEQQRGAEIQNGGNIPANENGNTFSFTQNNYSPKALSRVEIYRQTKNQFSVMERMVRT